MALQHAQHTATGTASAIARPTPGDNISGMNVEILNAGSNDVFIGGSGITSSNGGVTLAAGDSWNASNLGGTDTVYVITAGTSEALSILWTGV